MEALVFIAALYLGYSAGRWVISRARSKVLAALFGGTPAAILVFFLAAGTGLSGDQAASAVTVVAAAVFFYQASRPKRPASLFHSKAPEPAYELWSGPSNQIRFYYTDAQGNETERTVRVRRVYEGDSGHLYLKGRCELRRASRMFRFDRIQGPITDCDTGELLDKYAWLGRLRETAD